MKAQWKCAITFCVFGFLLCIPRICASDPDDLTTVPGDGQPAAGSCNETKGKITVVASTAAVEVNETTIQEWKLRLKTILKRSLAITTTEMDIETTTPTMPDDNGGGVTVIVDATTEPSFIPTDPSAGSESIAKRRRRRRRETNGGNDNAYPKLAASTDRNGSYAFTITLCGMTDEKVLRYTDSLLPEIATAWNIPTTDLHLLRAQGGGRGLRTGKRYSEVSAATRERLRQKLQEIMRRYGQTTTPSTVTITDLPPGQSVRRRRREIETTCDDLEIEMYQDETGNLAFAISCPSITSNELDEFLRIFAPQVAEVLGVSEEQIVAFPSIRSTNSPETGESSVNDTTPRTGEGHGEQPNTTPPGNGQDYNYTYTPKDSFLQCDCRCKAP